MPTRNRPQADLSLQIPGSNSCPNLRQRALSCTMCGVVKGFLDNLEQTIVRRQLLHNTQRILVAVSGGVDSMVLLDSFHRLASKHGWKLAVAHLNHQLRGKASVRDE